MMGPRQQRRSKLFYTDFNLESRVEAGHPLRKIAAACDFTLVRSAVASRYGRRGNPSLDPTLLLKLLFLLFYENVSSERELMRQLPCRLDWLWFLEMDLDSPIPDHSVLSKARRRWGPKVFAGFFQQILASCVQAGLVDGSRVHVDGSLIAADASMDKIQVALHLAGESLYGQLEAAMQEPTPDQTPDQTPRQAARQAPASVQTPGEQAVMAAASATPAADVPAAAVPVTPVSEASCVSDPPEACAPASPAPAASPDSPASPASVQTGDPQARALPPVGTRYCPTDPEARLTKKHSLTVLGYKDHRVVDERVGIITATLTTHAAVDEASMLMTLLDRHAINTGLIAYEPTADKGYGTAENYCRLQERGTTPCIPHKLVREDPSMFPRSAFVYDSQSDTYRCPAGQTLFRRGATSDDRYRYQPRPGVCANCPLKSQCTAGKQRVLSRQQRQDAIDWADECLTPGQRKQRLRRRKIRVEGSFADASNHHGYKRSRWRGLVRVEIQNLMIAATQNMRKLVRYANRRPHGGAGARPRHITRLPAALLPPRSAPLAARRRIRRENPAPRRTPASGHSYRR